MIYIINETDYDYSKTKTVLEGPKGFDLDRAFNQFKKQWEFTYRHPTYKGPKIPYKKPKHEGRAICSSGAIMFDMPKEGELVIDYDSPEYKVYTKMISEGHARARQRSEDKQEELRKKYPGKDATEMFVSYLLSMGFKHVEYNVNDNLG